MAPYVSQFQILWSSTTEKYLEKLTSCSTLNMWTRLFIFVKMTMEKILVSTFKIGPLLKRWNNISERLKCSTKNVITISRWECKAYLKAQLILTLKKVGFSSIAWSKPSLPDSSIASRQNCKRNYMLMIWKSKFVDRVP